MARRLALVIGTSLYVDTDNFSSLVTPLHDAENFAEVLKEYGEFEIVGKLIDANFDVVKYAIEDLYSQAQVGDMTLIYYSGHGYKSRNGQFYLIAKNTQVSRILSTGVDEDFIRQAMSSSRCRHKVVILDCCYSGTFISGQKSSDEAAIPEQLRGEATAIITSSSRTQLSFEDTGNSLFTRHLVMGIRTGQADADENGQITIEELFHYTEKRVKESRPDQTPMMASIIRDSQVIIARGMDLPRNKIFISSADNANENYFAAWLSAKLRLNGYEVIQDANGQDSQGVNYWDALANTLGKEAARFIFVASTESTLNNSFMKKLAIGAQMENRPNFIIPVELTTLLPSIRSQQLSGYDSINFSNGWSAGLRELIQELERRNVPKAKTPSSREVLAEWRGRATSKSITLLHQEEQYSSNWFEFSLPEFIYAYRVDSLNEPTVNAFMYPSIIEDGCVLTFGCPECVTDHFNVNSSEKIAVEEFLAHRVYSASRIRHIYHDTNNKIINLLNQAYSLFLVNKGLRKYTLSSTECFYFPKSHNRKTAETKISLKRYGKGTVQLTGNIKGQNWHMALEGNAFFYPMRAYFVTYHIIFTNNQGVPLAKGRQHSFRRRIGKDWYNKKWRDLVMGAMAWLAEDSATYIYAPVDCRQNIKIKSSPVAFLSPIGYLEPSKETNE